MSHSEKAQIIGEVLCLQNGEMQTLQKDQSGNILRKMRHGKVTVMSVDGLVYYLPTGMTEVIPCAEKG